MNILRSLEQIKTNAWGDVQTGEFILNFNAPVPAYNWDYTTSISTKDVTLWEQLHHEAGNFGLFVSWTPYIECYLLVVYPFLNLNKGYKIFYGPNACYEVRSFMDRMSLPFEVKKINELTIAI